MLIGGMASVQKFRRFARVSALPLSNPSYAPDNHEFSTMQGLVGGFDKSNLFIVQGIC